MNTNVLYEKMVNRLQVGLPLLSPLTIHMRDFESIPSDNGVDAVVEAGIPDQTARFRFAVQMKMQSTPKAVQLMVAQRRDATVPGTHPMVLVPFLGPERLKYLEEAKVSGIDLCGNGIIIVPPGLWLMRTGYANQFPESRSLSNPFRGRSALVARALLTRPKWNSLKQLLAGMREAGADISQAQASKAVQALEDELLLAKAHGEIKLLNPQRLLDMLGFHWRKSTDARRMAFRLGANAGNWAAKLASSPELKWAATGESSVSRYAQFSHGGPRRIAVSNLSLAESLLDAVHERIPNFADLEFIETQEPGHYFQTEMDAHGVLWASRLQTWLELQAGDAREQDAAEDIRKQILKEIQ
jgi:hypothetical protein